MSKYSTVEFNPFAGQVIQKICVTNESQKEIWLSCMFGGDNASLAYNLSNSLYFKGKLNHAALEKAAAALILRHESLRASFSNDGASMIIYENFPVELVNDDVSYLENDLKEAHLKDYINEQMSTPFNLENGPLLRLGLHQFGSESSVLTITIHHIIADGWSLNIFIEDLSYFYSKYTGVVLDKELKPAFQISTYSQESTIFEKTSEFVANENYWLQMYKSGIPKTNLTSDFPRSNHRSYEGERIDSLLDQDICTSLIAFSKQSNCSLVTLLISAFEVYIAKKTQQDELVTGVLSSGRPKEQHASMIGHCVKLLPLKATIDPHLRFIDYLKKRKTELLDAIDHELFTFSQLIKKLFVQRDRSRVPIVPIVFNFEREIGSGTHFNGLTFDLVSNPRKFENFELSLNIVWQENSAVLQFYYNKDVFKSTTIRTMQEEFRYFLQEVMNRHSATIQDLSIEMLKTTLAKITERNNTYSSYSKDKTLLFYFDKTAETYAKKTAIRFHEEQFSFKEINQQANQLAHILIENGVQKGDTIGIALRRSPKVIIAMLAVLKCGAVYIPLDPEFPHERIVYMLDNSSAKVLITSIAFEDHFQSTAKELLIEECWEHLSSYSTKAPNIQVQGHDLAYILYTSGSTGKPKGVQICHSSLLNLLLSMQKKPGIKSSDKWLAITTVSFDIAGVEIFLPLISGAEIVLADEGMARNGAELLSIIEEQHITILQATPATWTMMLYEGWEEKIPLKALCGGESFPKSLAHKLLERTNEVWNMYGPTETTIYSTIKKLSLDDELITIGRPIDNTLIYLLDDRLNMVQEGFEGEIYIAGDGLASGYINQADLTQEKFIDNPFEPEKSPKIYGTGDLGIALKNGEIQCLGRLDHQVKVRGFRIELGEIEYALSKIDSIKEVVAVAREDDPDDKRICAYVILNDTLQDHSTETVLKNDWRQKLEESLPAYMIPNEFILLTSFPLTPNGKIDRKQLPKPGTVAKQEVKVFTSKSPMSDLAKSIAKIWRESLRVDTINMNDDFFQLGGQSLIAIQLIMRLEKEIGKKIPITSLFKFSTFGSFVNLFESDEIIEKSSSSKWSHDDHLKDEEIIVPTTESQKGIWHSCLKGGDKANAAFNLSCNLRMHGALDIEAFRKSFNLIIKRHEAFRTNISDSGESLIIQPHRSIPLDIKDISNLIEEQQSSILKEFISKQNHTPFKLTEDPLLRITLHKLSSKSYYFTLITHSIICDGYSMNIILNELSELYNAYATGEDIKLPTPAQISNFALDQLTYNNSTDYHLTQDYWIKQFKENLPVLTFPVDSPREKADSYKRKVLHFKIEGSEFNGLKVITQEKKCSTATGLLSIFELSLYNQTCQNDIVIGLPIAGQTGIFYDLIGQCVNLLPIRSTVDSNETYNEYLKRRSSQLYSDYDHQKLNLNELISKLKTRKGSQHPPTIPILFSIQPSEQIDFNGITHELELYSPVAQTFDVSLYAILREDMLDLKWVYNSDLFKRKTIESFQNNFVETLVQVINNPELKIKDLPLNTRQNNDLLASSTQPIESVFMENGPRTAMEFLVADIWSEYLKIPVTNINSDFFKLGGHSMIAVKIMMAIAKRIGKRLPLATLFEHSTVESLAKKIDSGNKEKWKSLVPIKTSGNKPPLYIVHGYGMNVLTFKNMANSVDKDQPLYGLQSKGLDPNDDPDESVEEIAHNYVQELLEHNPTGPFVIAGYSSGGIIALEMSEQLLKLNKKIAFLGMIDTFYEGDSYAHLFKKNKFSEIINHAFKFIGYGFIYFARYPKAFLQHKINFILGSLYNQYKKINPLKKDLSNPLYILNRIQKVHDKAFKNYQIKHYSSNVTLFKGNQKPMVYIPYIQTNGFEPYITGNLKSIDVPVDHLKFFEPEFAEIFAKKMQKAINDCNY